MYIVATFSKKRLANWYKNSENDAVGKTFDMYLSMLSEYTLAFREKLDEAWNKCLCCT